ncbi:uncharacterized protein [Haliotis asinina]|uniref:uncharacterized protein n=1 Tax=Haliotis asinina TaxID=109174 RepID=UPI0035321CAF
MKVPVKVQDGTGLQKLLKDDPVCRKRRSLTRPQADTSPEGVVCSLSWETHPGQARVRPPNTQPEDMFQIPLQHISMEPYDWNIVGVDGGCSGQGADLPNCDASDSDISQTGNSVRGKALLQSKHTSSCLKTGSEFRSRATPQSPDGPTVSPCSSTSGSSADAASRSTSSLEERMLLKEVASRMPCIKSGQTIMASWADIREIFFPQCTSPGCNIVLNALKLQLKYPHAPSLMHVCSQSEQMSFLQRHLHLVVPGTLLIDVEAFLNHRSFLQAMVETKHLVTADVRSLSCCYGQTSSLSNDRSSQNLTKQKLKMLSGHVLPVVVAPGNTSEMTGDGKEARGAMVPLTMLPVLFPRYQRQLLLMATRFITMKSRAVIRRCSTTEAKMLNLWHLNAQGSNSQLVTSNDLLVRWQDVVTVVDPLVKHAARFGRSQSQQSSASSTSSSCSLRIARHPVQVVTGVKTSLMVGSKSNEKQSMSSDVSAETWMPKILNCYSTSDKRVEGSVDLTSALLSPSSSPPNSKVKAVDQVPNNDKDKTAPIKDKDKTELDQSQKIQQYITVQPSADDNGDEHVMHQKPISECSSSTSSSTLTPDSSDSGTLDALEKLCRFDSPEKTVTCNTQVLERPPESKQLKPEQRKFQHFPETKVKFRKHTETKPNQRKVFREGTRRSERIRDQTKVQNLQATKNVPVKKMETPIVVPCGSPEDTAKSEAACKCPDNNDTNTDKCSSSEISSEPTGAGDSCNAQGSSGTLENDQTQRLSHGFKDIAELFTVLTNEEVSHKSKQLAAAEIEDLAKKNAMSKTRQLGDLSRKGLQIRIPSDMALLLPTLETSSPSKSPEKDTRHSAKRSWKNRNIYPEMVIEAQKCSLGSLTPDNRQTHIKGNQVSVTDIMKSMDETFNAFKSDPVALVRAKMSSTRNLTGYVNTDYIRVTGPDPNITISQNDYKDGSLPPLMKYNVEYTSSGVTSNAPSNINLQNNFQKNHFEPVEDSRDVSALLKCPTPVHQWSLLDNRSSPTKLKPQLRPLIACPPVDDSATLKPEVSSEVSNPKDPKATRTVTPSPVKLVLMKTQSSTNPSKKPQWNIKKVIRASNVPKKPDTNCNERKARMDAEFNAMRARAIAKGDSAAATTVAKRTFAMTCNVMKPLCNKSALPDRMTGPMTTASGRNNPHLAGQVRVSVKNNMVNGTSKAKSLGQIQTSASSNTAEYIGASAPPGLVSPSNASKIDTTTSTVAAEQQNASDKLKLSEVKGNLQVKSGKQDVDSLSIVQKVDCLNIAGIKPKTTDFTTTENVKKIADPRDKKLPDSAENSNSVLKEKVSHSKKRQRVGEPEERRSLESTVSTVSSDDISTYWSGFPLGQSSRRLYGPKLHFPSYTVDYFMPPDNAPSSDIVENRPPHTAPPVCTPAPASANIFTNTGNDCLPSYVNWQRSVQPVRYLIPVFTNAPLYPPSQQSRLEAQNREHLINSRSMSADRSEFAPHHEGRYVSQLNRSASLGYNDCEAVPYIFNRDSHSRGAYAADTSNHHFMSSVDGEQYDIKHVQLPSFYKPLEEDKTISRTTTNSTANNQSVREPHVNSGKNKESVSKLDHTNSNVNKGSAAVTLSLGKGADVSEVKKAESTTGCSEVNSENALKVISLIPKNPVVTDSCTSSKSASPCCAQSQDISLAMQPCLGRSLRCKQKPTTGALNHQADSLEVTEAPGKKCESRSGTSSKVLTAARPHIGPFHERVRLEACGNIHNIRHTGTASKKEGHVDQQLSNLKERGPIELASGESIRWNTSNHLWVLDKNTNNNCSDEEECQENSLGYQLMLSPKKLSKSNLLPVRTVTSRCGERRPSKKSVHTVSSVSHLTTTANLNDVDDLLVTAMVTLRTLKTCLSKGRHGSNSNNNCDGHVSPDRKAQPVNKSGSSQPTINSSPSSACQVKVSLNVNNQQPVYPLYCSLVKNEPIKKNILLRETLRNNFELIKEISKCICTCKDAVMFVKPDERESYTRFLKKQYLKSLRHCPLHSGEASRQYKQEILILLDRLCKKVGKNQTKRGSKGKAKRGLRKTREKVTRQGQGCTGIKTVKNQWELNVARHYLASYVHQHYKKEIVRRFMQGSLQSSTLSSVNKKIQTKFIDVKESYKSVYDIELKTLSTKCEGNNSIDADREVRRQFKAKDRHSAQQELFMQILLQRKNRQLRATCGENTTADKTKDEPTQGDWCSRIEQLNIADTCRHKGVILNSSPVTCDDKPISAHWPGIQRREASKTVGHDICYQEVFSDSNTDMSYCGRVHISGLSLSYVMENGYKYLPLKQAIRLLPLCCCSISKAVLRTHPNLVRTFSTWEHVRLLDLMSGKRNQNNVQTGDVLVKLDTIIACLPDIEAEVKLRHQTNRPKKGLTCKY